MLLSIVQAIFFRFPSTLVKSFSGKNALYHLLAIFVTVVLVFSGADWWYFEFFKQHLFWQYIFLPATYVGFGLPIILPFMVFAFGKMKKNASVVNAAFALAQAGLMGLGVSIVYKLLTGRVPPEYLHHVFEADPPDNLSQVFQFGLGRGGIMYGWPSGHTISAICMVVCVLILFPHHKLLRWVSLVYAAYITIGMSTNLHWLSDVIAGVLVGTVIGITVGQSFANRFSLNHEPRSVLNNSVSSIGVR